eukprot:TRINITY_DN15336_c0_g1_i1.p1 TRINITY_DN15336_c0_g1~~TRINITY_DN15336_c0_g1_i1.p1  ORF type:complete len:114 (+),score=22.70 TRINITY_DN15336_c0_g1_i1:436-777(+)
MDETSIVVGFKSGDLVMVARGTLEIERTIETRLVRIRKLGLSPDFIYAGDLRNDRLERFYNPGSPSVCIYHRASGSLAHILSFQGVSPSTNHSRLGQLHHHLSVVGDKARRGG